MLNENGLKEALTNKTIEVDNGLENIKDNSIQVTLGDTLKVYESPVLDIKKTNYTKTLVIPEEGLLLEPNKLYLGRTNEYTKTNGYVPLLSGQDVLAAVGMEIHITAGFGDNGFEGTWTLEIICTNPTIVYPGMIIGEIYYSPLIGDDKITYQGKYLGQIEPTASRIEKDYKGSEQNAN